MASILHILYNSRALSRSSAQSKLREIEGRRATRLKEIAISNQPSAFSKKLIAESCELKSYASRAARGLIFWWLFIFVYGGNKMDSVIRKDKAIYRHFIAFLTVICMGCSLVMCGGESDIDRRKSSSDNNYEYIGSDTTNTEAIPGSPVLFFSDLESGPKTGWEGSTTKGAAITVWGKNFGSTKGTSYITVNGAQLTNDSDYAEWGVTTNNARGLERITFWIPSTAADGAGTITVTVNGSTSNSLPFTVRIGNIYFVATATGNDSYNGKYSSFQGENNGPWKNFYKANFQSNSTLSNGDIVYIKSGSYTTPESSNFAMHIYGHSCTNSSPCTIVGYPGESYPIVDTSDTEIYQEFSNGYRTDYWIVSKLRFQNGAQAIHTTGDGWRVIGCLFENYQANAWTGVIKPAASDNCKYLGLIFKDSGYDYYKHAIYPTCKSESSEDKTITFLEIGWNEIDRYCQVFSANSLKGSILNGFHGS